MIGMPHAFVRMTADRPHPRVERARLEHGSRYALHVDEALALVRAGHAELDHEAGLVGVEDVDATLEEFVRAEGDLKASVFTPPVDAAPLADAPNDLQEA